MHKTFTIFVFVVLFAPSLMAQEPACVPGLINPDTAIILPEPYDAIAMDGGLDSTCTGLAYEQILTVLTPATIPVNGVNFSLDSITIDVDNAIEGLPVGFSYSCNPPNCVFLPEESACIVITGIANENVPVGTYELGLTVTAFNPFVPTGLPLNYPNDFGNPNETYFIDIASEADCNVTVSTTYLEENLSSFISPNPTASFTELNVNATKAMDLQMVLVDVLGKKHVQRAISITAGQNIIPLQVQDLTQGIYFMSLTNGKEFISHKLVIEK